VTRPLACAAALFCLCPALSSYSVLTHEAVVDTVWDQRLKPLLLARFPNATSDELQQAHAYAYGGCIIQDMGYYPFGSEFFSHLVHYVRSGDFVVNMLRESQNLNEYAFALGALAHYASDNEGHSIAVNPSVSMQFPKLQRRFGKSVTFADNPTAHMKVEFGFDVLQVTRGMYAPQSYHNFIGFQVSKELLERAFRDTYSLDLKDVFTDLDLSIGTYRHTVSGLFPAMSKIAWSMKKKDLMKAQPTLNRTKFVYSMSTAAYRKEWDGSYEKPGLGARILGFVLRILPKVGPLKALQFKIPTPQTEKLFEASVDKTLDLYRTLLTDQERKQLALENRDFDTGRPTAPGEYKLADDTYANLAVKLAERDPASIDPAVRKDVLAFFRSLDAPYATKRDASLWSKTVAAVGRLKNVPVASGGQ
jgi:Zinc dependent phospholipase C